MLQFLHKKEVDQIYLYEFLQRFVVSLIGIFIPIQIVSAGLSYNLAFMYLIVMASVFAISVIPLSFIISKIGFKHGLIGSYLFYIPAFMLLRFYELNPTIIFGVAVVYAIAQALHWLSLNSEFAVDSTDGERSDESGKMIGLPRLAGTIAPVTGGLIMASFGFPMLVTVAMVFLVLSIIPLLMSGDHRDPLDYNVKDIWDKEHRKFAGLFVLRGADIGAAVYMFPLFVFLVIGGEVSAGGARTVEGIGAVLMALLTGKISDKYGRLKMIVAGLLAITVAHFARTMISTSTHVVILSFFAGLAFMVYYVPLYSIYADIAEDEDVLEFYALRDFFLNIGKMLLYVVAFGVSIYTGSFKQGMMAGFAYTGLCTLALVGYSKWLKEEDGKAL
jgi:predicted MFS family arabinose efflux permease